MNRSICAFLVLILVHIVPSAMYSQDIKKLDSLLNAYNLQSKDTLKIKTAHALFDIYYWIDPDKGLKLAKNTLNLSNELNYDYGIATTMKNLGRHFSRRHNLDSATYYLNQSLKHFTLLDNSHQIGLVKYYLANTLLKKGNYEQAHLEIDKNLTYYTEVKKDSALLLRLHKLKASVYMRQTKYDLGIKNAMTAIEIAKNINDQRELLGSYTTLGNLYNYIIDDENSIKYQKKALEIGRKLNDKAAIATNLNNLGNSHYFIKKYDESLNYLFESLKISEELENNGRIATTTFIIGRLYVETDRVNKGIPYLNRSIHYSRNIAKNPLSHVWGLNGLTRAYIKLKKPLLAIKLSNQAIQIADSIGNIDDLYVAYQNKMDAYKLEGNYKLALENHIKYKAVYDSVYNIEKSKEIQNLTKKFETKEKEQQIVLQENEIDLLEEKEKVSSLQKSLLSGGLLLSLVLITIGFYGFKQRLKRNKLEREKVEAELMFKKKELTTHALHLAKKNEVLEGLKMKAEVLKKSDNSDSGYQQLIKTINFDLKDDNNWENFSKYFQEVHTNFNDTVKEKFPSVTANELRLMALLKMNLSSKEIANILNISPEGIKKARYRLRKKLNITDKPFCGVLRSPGLQTFTAQGHTKPSLITKQNIMKMQTKVIKKIMLLCLFIMTVACSKDDSMETPTGSGELEEIGSTISLDEFETDEGEIGIRISARNIAKKGYKPVTATISIDGGAGQDILFDEFNNLAVLSFESDELEDSLEAELREGVPVTVTVKDENGIELSSRSFTKLSFASNPSAQEISADTLDDQFKEVMLREDYDYYVQLVDKNNEVFGAPSSQRYINGSLSEEMRLRGSLDYDNDADLLSEYTRFRFAKIPGEEEYFSMAKHDGDNIHYVYMKNNQLFVQSRGNLDRNQGNTIVKDFTNYWFKIERQEEGFYKIIPFATENPLILSGSDFVVASSAEPEDPTYFRILAFDIDWDIQGIDSKFLAPIMPPSSNNSEVNTALRNCGNVTTRQTVGQSESVTSFETVSWEESMSVATTNSGGVSVTISHEAETKFFGTGGKTSGSVTGNYQYTKTRTATATNAESFGEEKTAQISVAREVTVPPGQAVAVADVYQQYTDVKVPFVQRFRVYGKYQEDNAPLSGDEILTQFNFNGFTGVVTEVNTDFIEVTVRGNTVLERIIKLTTETRDIDGGCN